jgi:Domain of unknown function (DUF4338)
MVSAPLIQGRMVTPGILAQVRGVIAERPGWSRRRLALELCRQWQWHNAAGQIKDMAARSFLDKLEARGCLELPPRQGRGGPGFAPRLAVLPPAPKELKESLAQLRPLQWQVFSARQPQATRFNAYLARYHYLPYRSTVGENLGYLVQDRQGRDLACALFGAAAWKIRPRDAFIGWTANQRQTHLGGVVNNSRFLILPWVRVPELASHILGRVARRVARDWQARYSHPVVLLETFVERSRFRGSCYRAANWICVGQTQGRTRQDRQHQLQAPVKDILVYPLQANFRAQLCHVHA